jgi:predicted transcriptional regulator of viral defense system
MVSMGAPAASVQERLSGLPTTFTHGQARDQAHLSDRQLRQSVASGWVERLDRGLYRRLDVLNPASSADIPPADVGLLVIARRASMATLCLGTALARYGLTDEIPESIDIALPRGCHRPTIAVPVTWHLFDPPTFLIGRRLLPLDTETNIGIYSPERCIIDAFRLAHLEGREQAVEALKRWLRHPTATPASLMEMARRIPRAERALHDALVILQ